MRPRKAASDHLVRAYHHTYGLPTLTTNCSNNYGPFQFPEKLIPLDDLNALDGKPLPVYGDGRNIRDWLFVSDHCTADPPVLEAGRLGETYNIGGKSEQTEPRCRAHDLPACSTSCARSRAAGMRTRSLSSPTGRVMTGATQSIRPRSNASLAGFPRESFETGIRRTVLWYLENGDWVERVRDGRYREWVDRQYGT